MHKCQIQYEVGTRESRDGGGVSVKRATTRVCAWPIEGGRLPAVHTSRFRMIPKCHQPGKWRLIVDLSHPAGASVNDGIEPKLCILRYSLVDEAVKMVLCEGWNARLTNLT